MKYKYYVDTKYTMWDRNHYEIEANSQEEADELAKKLADNEERQMTDFHIETEPLYDTFEEITPDENNGYSTAEVYREDGEIIIQNGK